MPNEAAWSADMDPDETPPAQPYSNLIQVGSKLESEASDKLGSARAVMEFLS